jgi:DNA ligase-associated metallophosphoesterase
MLIERNGEVIELMPEKALWLKNRKVLMIADLHFGKINHFRKAGIPVPVKANDKNAEVLINLLSRLQPERVIFLGDLFHSHYNEEWEVLGQICRHYVNCSFELVLGNHDIMSRHQYERHNMMVHEQQHVIGSFLLTHEPLTEVDTAYYNLSGHIHPGVTLMGTAKQSITLPCFYFGKQQGILPAFGAFTGLARITPKKDEKVFVVAEGKIVEIAG